MFADYLVTPPQEIKLGKTIPLSWEGFQKMLTYNGVGRRFSNPDLVKTCLDRLQQNFGNVVKVTQIHVDRKSLLRLDQEKRQVVKMSDEELLEANISTIVGSKAIIKMEVKGLTEAYSPSIAISLSEHGEQIAFGGSVTICSNLTILNKDRYFSTHQRHANRNKKRMTFDELLVQIDDLFPRMDAVLEDDLKAIERYKNMPVSKYQWDAFVGSLFSRIHYVNRKRLNRQIASLPLEIKDLPITASHLADIVAEAVEPSHDVYRFVDGVSSVWNCINYGTEQLKAVHGLPPQQVLQANSNWADIVVGHQFSNN